jgi:hypothetical protein
VILFGNGRVLLTWIPPHKWTFKGPWLYAWNGDGDTWYARLAGFELTVVK